MISTSILSERIIIHMLNRTSRLYFTTARVSFTIPIQTKLMNWTEHSDKKSNSALYLCRRKEILMFTYILDSRVEL